MTEIVVRRKHRLTAPKARIAAGEVAEALAEEFGLSYEWEDSGLLRFRGLGVHGELSLSRGQATVAVRLGLLLTPFASSLEAEIHRYFDERFGPAR